jgi:16S rRNA (guanine527-N7)-methyltransferase
VLPVDLSEQSRAIFGSRYALAERYARRLATDGITRGLLGPREAGRIWERHLLNCAVVSELLPERTRVVDVGSGAGLPGLVLAIRRPDLRVDLVESLARRVDFLVETVEDLGLSGSVRVVRGRAEDAEVRAAVGGADWVTARAVAPLDRLARWAIPLLAPGGRLVALKGGSAPAEIQRDQMAVRRAGGSDPVLMACGTTELAAPTSVIVVRRRAGQPKEKT